jgi:hypothetical protein
MIPGCIQPAPPPVMVDGEEQWVIERFVNSHWFHNQFQLKIWWEGYMEEHDKWKNYEDLE